MRARSPSAAAAVRVPHPPGGGATGLARRRGTSSTSAASTTRAPRPVAPQRRAPVHDRDRAALLVAGAGRRAALGADARPDRLRLRRLRRCRPSSASRSRSRPVLRLLREPAERLWGISAAKDQNLGGILMTTEQALVFFAASSGCSSGCSARRTRPSGLQAQHLAEGLGQPSSCAADAVIACRAREPSVACLAFARRRENVSRESCGCEERRHRTASPAVRAPALTRAAAAPGTTAARLAGVQQRRAHDQLGPREVVELGRHRADALAERVAGGVAPHRAVATRASRAVTCRTARDCRAAAGRRGGSPPCPSTGSRARHASRRAARRRAR